MASETESNNKESLAKNEDGYQNGELKFPFQVKQRVKRKNEWGSLGTVISIREETNTSRTSNIEVKHLIIVEWDNGTTSWLAPEALEDISE